MSNPVSRRRVLAIGTAAGLALGLPVSTRAETLQRFGIVGRAAPPLRVDHWIDAAGNATTFDPSSIDGKWVMIKCWQSWCPGCHKHGFPTLKTVVDAFHGEDRLRVLAVQTVFEGFTINTRDKLREAQVRYGLPILMGHDSGDPDGDHRPRTMRDYRTGGTPWFIIIEPDGTVVFNDYHLSAERFIDYLRARLA